MMMRPRVIVRSCTMVSSWMWKVGLLVDELDWVGVSRSVLPFLSGEES